MVDAKNLYLDLLKQCLTYSIWGETHEPVTEPLGFIKRMIFLALNKMLDKRGIRMVRHKPFDRQAREEGRDWPVIADTMIGLKRLDNLQFCVEDVLVKDIPGDLIETGVWRGGASIFMRAILKTHNIKGRRVWVADSFEGVPSPNVKLFPADAEIFLHTFKYLAVSLEQVKSNFSRYGLLDEQVQFLKGWFRDTLPTAPIQRLSVIRLDGDLYESTMDALENLYPKLSVGGYLIVDDYGAVPACRQAVHDYRNAHGINDEIRPIDWSGVYWKRSWAAKNRHGVRPC